MKKIIGPISILLMLTANCSYFVTDYRLKEQKFDNPICSIHNVKMKTKICKLRYGIDMPFELLYFPNEYKNKIKYDSLYAEAIKTTFANAYLSDVVYCGCKIKSQKWVKIYYCNECNRNRKKWFKENEILRPSIYYDIREYIPRNKSESRN
jgi:hypothetical protein